MLLGILASFAPLSQHGLGVPVEVLSLIMLAPAAAALVVLMIRPRWWPTKNRWPHAPWSTVALSAGLALLAVAGHMTILSLMTGSWPSFPAAVAGVPLAIFFASQALGALCEEIGWRGLVQKCGEQWGRPVVVSAIQGFFFGATHLGYWELGVVPVLLFSLSTAVLSLAITTLWSGSFWQRMIPATIIHAGLNLVLFGSERSGEPALPLVVMLIIAVAGRLVFGSILTRRQDAL